MAATPIVRGSFRDDEVEAQYALLLATFHYERGERLL
jgi:hypothetical protein